MIHWLFLINLMGDKKSLEECNTRSGTVVGVQLFFNSVCI